MYLLPDSLGNSILVYSHSFLSLAKFRETCASALWDIQNKMYTMCWYTTAVHGKMENCSLCAACLSQVFKKKER